MKAVLVYCGANAGRRAEYAETAYALGQRLAARSMSVIYGGGHLGLMGKVADGAIDAGGTVTGIIPGFLARLELAHESLTEMHLVETMHERKAKMASLSDGVIALPGGFGTMDEFFEILTWVQLGIFHGPVALLNVNGFYDFLLAHFDRMIEEGFLPEENKERLIVEKDVDGLLDRMESFHSLMKNKFVEGTFFIKDPSK